MLHPDNAGGLGFECESTQSSSCSDASTISRHYISAGGQAIGVLVSTGPLPLLAINQTAPTPLGASTQIIFNKVEYWHKDHLGSLIATTDHAGAVTARYAYDPFGKRRNINGSYDEFGTIVVDWTGNTNKGTDRGFTGHEHLDDIGLIHMNGRIYDANLGRFLQADPLMIDPLGLQNYNRYAYCYNNPLTCTDPTGHGNIFENFFNGVGDLVTHWSNVVSNDPVVKGIVITYIAWQTGGAISGYLGVQSAVGQAAISGFIQGAMSTGNLQGALQGSFAAASFAIGGDLITGSGVFAGSGMGGWGNGTWQAVTVHGVAGCVSNVVGGGQCGPGALSAAFSEAVLPYKPKDRVLRVATSAIIGGTASVLGGGTFANGDKTATFGYLYNECLHTRMCGSDSTRVAVSGNKVALDLAHMEVQISSGYEFNVLEGQWGYNLQGSDTTYFTAGGGGGLGANAGGAFTFDLVAPSGDALGAVASRMREGASLYQNDVRYGYPNPTFQDKLWPGTFNSNSYVGGLIRFALPNSDYLLWQIQNRALANGFKVPGLESPLHLGRK